MFFLKNHSRENQIPVDYGTWGNWWCFFGKRKILTFGQKLKKSTSKTRRFMQGGYKICTWNESRHSRVNKNWWYFCSKIKTSDRSMDKYIKRPQYLVSKKVRFFQREKTPPKKTINSRTRFWFVLYTLIVYFTWWVE